MFKGTTTHLGGGLLHSAPAERNTGPILEVLQRVLPAGGRVLEIASGTGQHVVAFAAAMPQLHWQPSDPDDELRDSTARRVAEAGLDNVAAPVALDVTRHPWRIDPVSAVVCINMIHIAPWEATLALFAGAREALTGPGVVVTYGPYMQDGRHTSTSNAAFDESLRSRNPAWGVREVDRVAEAARASALELTEIVTMPANNLTLVFRGVGHAHGYAV